MLESFTANKEDKRKQLDGIMLIVSAIIWGIGFLFLFDNMGYDITAIIAGLGIGGIAIALAAQNILGDLFNYFVTDLLSWGISSRWMIKREPLNILESRPRALPV